MRIADSLRRRFLLGFLLDFLDLGALVLEPDLVYREMRYELEQIASALIPFTCTILRLSPVSLARFSRTLRHGLGDTSKEALKARLCCVLSMVRGRLGPRRPSSLGGNNSSP